MTKVSLGLEVRTTKAFWDRQWLKSKEQPDEGLTVRDTLLSTRGAITCINGDRITLDYRRVFDRNDLQSVVEKGGRG